MHVDCRILPVRWGAWLALIVTTLQGAAHGENLQEAWQIALGSNQQLLSSRQTSEATGFDLAASRRERLPTIQSLNAEAFLFRPLSLTGFGSGSSTASSGSQAQGTAQSDFTFSVVAAAVPLYSGGRIRNTIEANQAQVSAARADECRTALDLKLDVARSYVSVLRAGRTLAVSRSNVQNLAAHAHDVSNLVEHGRAIRNDLLAAQVALANARQREIFDSKSTGNRLGNL